MNAAGRLAAYATGLIVVFAGSFATASAVIPTSASSEWKESTTMSEHTVSQPSTSHQGNADEPSTPGHMGHIEHGSSTGNASGTHNTSAAPLGVSLAQDGYVLSAVSAPAAVGVSGELSFQLLSPAGIPVVNYVRTHDKDLHLIVVRSDGTQFRHVHPILDAAGTWSIPWSWQAGGTYRVFADFTAAGATSGMTLSRTVDVAGNFAPAAPAGANNTAQVDGFTVTLTGDLTAGATNGLQMHISREGQPVTTLQPYLGAFGHLVALRQGDLAYLHVHPEGEAPTGEDDTSGPQVSFMAEAPTVGRYLLYLDFHVDGQVHTAQFVVDATTSTSTSTGTGTPGSSAEPSSSVDESNEHSEHPQPSEH